MPDFWPSCGYRLLAVDADGRLAVTDDFLRALLLRPELAPIPESCAAELALHEKLLATPRAVIAESELAPVAERGFECALYTFAVAFDCQLGSGFEQLHDLGRYVVAFGKLRGGVRHGITLAD